ncbi:hypothetical protein NX722_07570 [Endozoicomonas gorgoniicola]|uniref:Uncharacterized protein n=1 Tax=Endozoicomonas gorgoniicola TaxID=1234144 RepID=A0ABT3MSZ6_9GAMM|nr:hypothetical protein [Endozoicomonas gorgoniicola]MCW7552506.1 hypothetical protein [Endozoicomonas gorgoniicola]
MSRDMLSPGKKFSTDWAGKGGSYVFMGFHVPGQVVFQAKFLPTGRASIRFLIGMGFHVFVESSTIYKLSIAHIASIVWHDKTCLNVTNRI